VSNPPSRQGTGAVETSSPSSGTGEPRPGSAVPSPSLVLDWGDIRHLAYCIEKASSRGQSACSLSLGGIACLVKLPDPIARGPTGSAQEVESHRSPNTPP